MAMNADDFRRLIARYRGRSTQALLTYDELATLACLNATPSIFTRAEWNVIKRVRAKLSRTPPPMGSSLLDDLWRLLVLDPDGEVGSMSLNEYWRLRAVLGAERRLKRFLASRPGIISEIQQFLNEVVQPEVLLSDCAETICGRGHHSLGIKSLLNSVKQRLGDRAQFIIRRRLAALNAAAYAESDTTVVVSRGILR